MKHKTYSPSANRGFTLMELLIYIGIFAGISVAVVSVVYMVSTAKPGIDAKTEVQQNMRLALDTINLKTAQSVSVKTAQSGLLELVMPTEAASTTIFTLQDGVLYMKEGTAATTTLTSDKVSVDSLEFGQVFQPPAPRSVSVAMTMSYKAGGNPLLEFSSAIQSLFPIARAVTFDSALLPAAAGQDIGASTLRWRDIYLSGNALIGGSVGIGTASPARELHIVGADGSIAGAIVDVYGTGLTSFFVGRGARGTQSSPSAVQTGDYLMFLGGAGYGTARTDSRAAIVMRAAENWAADAHGTNIGFYTTPTGSATRQERMRINPAGNVGIGTTTPGTTLEVAGDVKITGASDLLRLDSGSTREVTMGIRDGLGRFSIYQNAETAGGYYINSEQANRITMHITGISFYTAPSGTAGNAITWTNAGNISQGSVWWSARGISSDLYVKSDGNVGIGTTGPGYTLTVNGTAWVTSGAWSGSDIRWKKDITPLPLQGSLDKVMQLNPVSFDWRTDEFPNMRFSSGAQLGFIGQDVEKIIPEAVTTDNNGYKGISYERIAPVLTAAIQEQQKQIEELKSEIKKLQINGVNSIFF